jgi:hypothetical protein
VYLERQGHEFLFMEQIYTDEGKNETSGVDGVKTFGQQCTLSLD